MSKSSHGRALETMAKHPDKFGITQVVSYSIEETLFDQEKILAQPDLIFYCKSGDYYILEYKGDGNGEILERATLQLSHALWWFGKYRSEIPPSKIHSRLVTNEELKKLGLLR